MFWIFAAIVILIVIGYGASISTKPAMVTPRPPADTHLSLRLVQQFSGAHELVVQTCRNLGALLQQQWDANNSPSPVRTARPVDATTYLTALAAQFGRLRQTFARAETDFERAAGPGGGPDQYAQAYGAVLADLAEAGDAIHALQPPPRCAPAAQEFERFIDSLQEQLALWPKRLEAAANSVDGESVRVSLSVSYNIGPLERAIIGR